MMVHCPRTDDLYRDGTVKSLPEINRKKPYRDEKLHYISVVHVQ